MNPHDTLTKLSELAQHWENNSKDSTPYSSDLRTLIEEIFDEEVQRLEPKVLQLLATRCNFTVDEIVLNLLVNYRFVDAAIQRLIERGQVIEAVNPNWTEYSLPRT